jgi:hypothetical protein
MNIRYKEQEISETVKGELRRGGKVIYESTMTHSFSLLPERRKK